MPCVFNLLSKISGLTSCDASITRKYACLTMLVFTPTGVSSKFKRGVSYTRTERKGWYKLK
jgi:hypothetical protein